jgi:hypothetical protein
VFTVSDNSVRVTNLVAKQVLYWLNDHIGRGSVYFRPQSNLDAIDDLKFLWWADPILTRTPQTFNVWFKHKQDLVYFILSYNYVTKQQNCA